jgi:hypothetical protein
MKPAIGERAIYTGPDHGIGYPHLLHGDSGTIVWDAKLDPNGSNFGQREGNPGVCGWQKDGEVGVYLLSLADLRSENDIAVAEAEKQSLARPGKTK